MAALMDDLVAFLRAMLDEREAKASAAKRFHPTPWRLDPAVETTMDTGRWVADANDDGVLVANGDAAAKFYADNDPAYVLADVESKRRLLELHQHSPIRYPRTGEDSFGCEACHVDIHDGSVVFGGGWCEHVRLLAAPFSDHSLYQGGE